jgi:hypothetical protein
MSMPTTPILPHACQRFSGAQVRGELCGQGVEQHRQGEHAAEWQSRSLVLYEIRHRPACSTAEFGTPEIGIQATRACWSLLGPVGPVGPAVPVIPGRPVRGEAREGRLRG